MIVLSSLFSLLQFHKMCERQVFIKDINPAKTIITTDGKEFREKDDFVIKALE